MLEPRDAELVARAQRGDVNAVGQLYDRHQARIFRYVRSRVHNNQLAQDLTGEVFLRMVAALPEYRITQAPFAAWLYSIARNLIADHYLKEGGRMAVPIQEVQHVIGEGTDPAAVVEQQLTLERVQRALERIDETQREVIRLRFLVGLSLREVAESLGKTVAAVKSLQHRGLLALRAALQQEV